MPGKTTRNWANRRRRVHERDGRKCYVCRREIRPGEGTVDHVVPKSLGGTDHVDNLKACCVPCNKHKADRVVASAALYARLLNPDAHVRAKNARAKNPVTHSAKLPLRANRLANSDKIGTHLERDDCFT